MIVKLFEYLQDNKIDVYFVGQHQGECKKPYVVLKDGEELSDDLIHELEKSCKKNLDLHHQPFKFEQVNELLTTSVGKVDYKALEKKANDSKVNVKRR